MALVKCKECGAQVSTKAAACPSCGAKRKGGGGCIVGAGKLIGGLIGLGVALAFLAALTNKSEDDLLEELRTKCRAALNAAPAGTVVGSYTDCVDAGTARLRERGLIK